MVNVFMVFTVEDTSACFPLLRGDCRLLTFWVLAMFLGPHPLGLLYLFTIFTIPPEVPRDVNKLVLFGDPLLFVLIRFLFPVNVFVVVVGISGRTLVLKKQTG